MASPFRVKIGTRGSPLALFQARYIADALKSVSDGVIEPDIVPMTTKGDQLTTERLINSGGKGLFTREIDAAVTEGRVHIGVHSLKDVPSLLPDGQEVLAYPERADARDGLVTKSGTQALRDLPDGAVLGTASLRREAQALALRPDLKVVSFRGSVQTRLQKLEDGLAEATFLAMAGLDRLGLAAHARPVPVSEMLPAAGQGIIAVVGIKENLPQGVLHALDQLDHVSTRCMATAERAFLKELDGSCRTAMAAHLTNEHGKWRLRGEVLAPDGQTVWRAEATALLSASLEALERLGIDVAKTIRAEAGGALPIFEDV